MKITVDQLKCDTSGVCVKGCPDIFRFQEGSKKADVTMDEIPLELQVKCIEIAGQCPTGAIQIDE